MHEFVISTKKYRQNNGTALNIAKRIIDYGIHPPTIYFPLLVEEAMMLEPAETETLENLDHIAGIFKNILEEIKNNPEVIKRAPFDAPVGRINELKAVKEPVLRD
jgi:glycine dehydrogenase subunit 2